MTTEQINTRLQLLQILIPNSHSLGDGYDNIILNIVKSILDDNEFVGECLTAQSNDEEKYNYKPHHNR